MRITKILGARFTVLITCFLLIGCTNDGLNPPPFDPKESDFDVSGVWLASGGEDITTYSEWPIPPGEEPEVEEHSLGFVMLIEQMDDGHIRIIGLPGADVGRADGLVFTGCLHPDNCEVIGNEIGKFEWEIDIQRGDRSYNALFSLKRFIDLNQFTLEGTYEFQNRKIEYRFDGERAPE
ncbi:MAG: hypothetical protein GVY02_03150 [Bacteroidetes bacterium]|nr:hypothetical protein [Bacteroidota bacterium]